MPKQTMRLRKLHACEHQNSLLQDSPPFSLLLPCIKQTLIWLLIENIYL